MEEVCEADAEHWKSVGAARVSTREKAAVPGVTQPKRCYRGDGGTGSSDVAAGFTGEEKERKKQRESKRHTRCIFLPVKKKKGRHNESPRDKLVTSSSFNLNPRGNRSHVELFLVGT